MSIVAPWPIVLKNSYKLVGEIGGDESDPRASCGNR